MKRERKNKLAEQFTGPLWDDQHPDFSSAAMDELANASHEETFQQDWFYPLLAEGVEFEQIVDLLLSSKVRPN
ncbi:MAG TPA: hypothetical protein VMU53_17515 [Candidatus Sulfotelmatobacter sp.]|nr:hypothetical protein [Candidatus Sulfotelmatobacter sp.]